MEVLSYTHWVACAPCVVLKMSKWTKQVPLSRGNWLTASMSMQLSPRWRVHRADLCGASSSAVARVSLRAYLRSDFILLESRWTSKSLLLLLLSAMCCYLLRML